MIPFGEWTPDLPAFQSTGTLIAKDVVPHAFGFAPIPGDCLLADALTARCRGAVHARNKSNVVYMYAGDATKLYYLLDGTWTDITSASGAYTTAEKENWAFARWNEKIIASNFTDVIQETDLDGTVFTTLAGSPPQCRHMAVAANFLICGNINDVARGDGLVPNRVHWSGVNNIETWVSSATTQADYQDLKGSGGWVNRIFGGEYAIVFQENSIQRMTYVGSPIIWDFAEVATEIGLMAPGLASKWGESIFFLSQRGFYVLRGGAQVESIGETKVNEFVLGDIDRNYLHRCTSTIDTNKNQVWFSYPGVGHDSGLPNKVVIYDWTLNRWSYSEQDVQALIEGVTAEYTMDSAAMATLSASNLDSLTVLLDTDFYTGGTADLAKFNGDNKLALLCNTPRAAVVETAEIEVNPGTRTMVVGVRPIVEGGTTTIQLGHRDTQGEDISWSNVASGRSTGRHSVRKNARFHRVRANISGDWDHALGVEIESVATEWR